ncbi:MAG: hypothetical protein Q4B75_08765 [Eubacteriales bacterium]|nr:hypothetical protein [Eubacteriales bacterium]
MIKKGYSQGLFGGVNHYDSYGRKKGHSSRGFLSEWNHYDD